MDAALHRAAGLGARMDALAERMDAFNEGDHPRDANGKFGSGGGHGVSKVEPTESGARYHVGKHKLEVTRKGGYLSHTQEGMTGDFGPKISKGAFPHIHQSVKGHLAEHGPHPEAGGGTRVKEAPDPYGRMKQGKAEERKMTRGGFRR